MRQRGGVTFGTPCINKEHCEISHVRFAVYDVLQSFINHLLIQNEDSGYIYNRQSMNITSLNQ